MGRQTQIEDQETIHGKNSNKRQTKGVKLVDKPSDVKKSKKVKFAPKTSKKEKEAAQAIDKLKANVEEKVAKSSASNPSKKPSLRQYKKQIARILEYQEHEGSFIPRAAMRRIVFELMEKHAKDTLRLSTQCVDDLCQVATDELTRLFTYAGIICGDMKAKTVSRTHLKHAAYILYGQQMGSPDAINKSVAQDRLGNLHGINFMTAPVRAQRADGETAISLARLRKTNERVDTTSDDEMSDNEPDQDQDSNDEQETVVATTTKSKARGGRGKKTASDTPKDVTTPRVDDMPTPGGNDASSIEDDEQ